VILYQVAKTDLPCEHLFVQYC